MPKTLVLDFTEVATVVCPDCDGQAGFLHGLHYEDTDAEPCEFCNGTGYVTEAKVAEREFIENEPGPWSEWVRTDEQSNRS